MKTCLNILFLNLLCINLLFFELACRPNGSESLLKEFVNSYKLDGRHILLVDLDKCASCHFKGILDLCEMKCTNLLLLVYTTNHAKEKVLKRDCGNAKSSAIPIHFFSEKSIMESIHNNEGGSIFLITKDEKNEISIETVSQVENILPNCS